MTDAWGTSETFEYHAEFHTGSESDSLSENESQKPKVITNF